MFARYALALGRGAHRHSLHARSQSAGLRLCAETSELLLVAPDETPFLADHRSILVGQLFRFENQRVNAPPPDIADAVCATDLRRTLKDYWGNFALFFANRNCLGAYREPSGSVSMYGLGGEDTKIYISDAELALKLGLLNHAAPDPHFLIHWLQFPFLRTRRTGLQDVFELLPGVAAIRRDSRRWIEESAWHPQAFVTPANAIVDAAQAARRVREVALAVVPAQLKSSGNLLLRLSGGLDSSIIAGCCAHQRISFSSVNFATRSCDGDERRFAREVAEASGTSLQEIMEPREVGIDTPARLSFRPWTNPILLSIDRAIQSFASDVGTSITVDGAGGDNLFCSLSSATPVIDALRSWHIADSVQAVSDIAERANCTSLDVLLAATKRLARQTRPWKEDRSFLSPAVLLRLPEPHPWLTNLRTLPGKREHVEALVHIHHFLDRGMVSTRSLHPLLCQPLLELCLRIPTWFWVAGGRDRAVARAAFPGIVPESVLARRLKGSLQSMVHRSFSDLRLQMLEILVSGELSRDQIIDARTLKAALSGCGWHRDEVQLRISEMVALELWLRSWRSHSPGPPSGS